MRLLLDKVQLLLGLDSIKQNVLSVDVREKHTNPPSEVRDEAFTHKSLYIFSLYVDPSAFRLRIYLLSKKLRRKGLQGDVIT